MTNSIRWVEPFAYKPGEPFRIMPVGDFKRGDRELKITKDRLEALAANANNGRPRWHIPLYLGHPTEQNPDPPKVGNVTKLEVRDDGLYAFPEWTGDGEKAVTDGAYQFNSPGVMWSLNGSAYADEKGNKFDNVLDHVALTNKPWFGRATALFSEPGVLEKFQLEGEPKTRHTLASVMGMLKNVMTALQAAKVVEDDPDADGDTDARIVNALPVEKPAGANSAPVDPVPPVVEKGKPVDMTDAGVMKNQLPREAQVDLHAALPPMVKCPECGQPMPKGTKCPKCGYQDKGDQPTEKMSGAGDADTFRDYDPETRQAMAKKGEALPNGSYPIANAADLQNAISAVGRGGPSTALVKAHIIKRAKALGLDDRLPADWEGSTKEKEAMSETTSPESFAIQPEEFAALKAKADQFDALKAQVDTYAAELAKEKRARRIDVLRARYDGFSVPLEGQKTAELMHDLEAAAPELFGKIDALLETLDTQVKQAGLFAQISSARPGTGPATFDAAVQKVLKEKFNGDMARFSDAGDIVAKEQPDLYAEYRRSYAPNQGN